MNNNIDNEKKFFPIKYKSIQFDLEKILLKGGCRFRRNFIVFKHKTIPDIEFIQKRERVRGV